MQFLCGNSTNPPIKVTCGKKTQTPLSYQV
jgi:hypothetical protein